MHFKRVHEQKTSFLRVEKGSFESDLIKGLLDFVLGQIGGSHESFIFFYYLEIRSRSNHVPKSLTYESVVVLLLGWHSKTTLAVTCTHVLGKSRRSNKCSRADTDRNISKIINTYLPSC